MKLLGKQTYAERVSRILADSARSEGAFVWGSRRYRGQIQAVEQGPSVLMNFPRPRGVTVLVTDGLDQLDWSRLLQKLRRVVLVQVMAPEELTPPLTEALLRDVEAGGQLEVGEAEARGYQLVLENHLRRLKTTARRLGSYALLRVGEPVVSALLRQGVLEEG